MKIKIILGLLLVFLIVMGFLSRKNNDYREKEVQGIKEQFISIKLEECFLQQKVSAQTATLQQREKCKVQVYSEWEEATVLNSQY